MEKKQFKQKQFILLLFSLLIIFFIKCTADSPTENNESTDASSLKVFDEILFYDGYAETVSEPVPQGVTRISNSAYIKKIDESFVNSANKTLDMKVVVKAGCDNYDRIGNVYLSLLPKSSAYNESSIVSKIEVARFITPFMDKNESPMETPYEFEIDNIAKLFNDENLSNDFDFWLELDIFGVPYAANKEIEGCEGECYTFYGTVILNTGDEASDASSQYFLPLACNASLNNYNDTEVQGKTVKSFDIELDSEVKDAKLFVITSNHGANAGGEEYNRRDHYIYFDEDLVDVYKPGGKSCEPFRQYNTQSNGIYGHSKKSDQEWASFSNWCPGDKIPIRTYNLGDLSQGSHTFKIEVPDAKFVDQQGNIPLSVYLQGDM